mgnify:CR=1 FL=1
MLRWQQAESRRELVDYYRGLIALRKQLPGLYDKSREAADRIIAPKVLGESVVGFQVDNRGDDTFWDRLLIIYNGSDEEFIREIPQGEIPQIMQQDWEVLADGEQTNIRRRIDLTAEGIKVGVCSGLMLGLRRAGAGVQELIQSLPAS